MAFPQLTMKPEVVHRVIELEHGGTEEEGHIIAPVCFKVEIKNSNILNSVADSRGCLTCLVVLVVLDVS